MNILLVDDDRFIIKALQETIHWEALGIEQVYTASSPEPSPSHHSKPPDCPHDQ